MKRKNIILLIICCLQSMVVHLRAESITYDFSSTEFWVISPGGNTHPETGTSALLKEIYYAESNDCFVGRGDVYFNSGYLMLKPNASLMIPRHSDWIVNKVTLHSHSGVSVSVKVNIFESHSGTTTVSTAQKWEKGNFDYVYEIKESFKEASLYIRTSNSYNARIVSITIDYTSSGGSSDDSPTDILVAAPTFVPVSTMFSSESLDVTISAAEGCDVYYTTDGTTPSYTDAETFVGTKGKAVTIAAGDSKVTLQAIAVDPTTGKCSEVSSATYTYVPIVNDGTKEKPYTVAEVAAMKVDKGEGYWVKGTIYGTMLASGKIEEVTTSASEFVSSNMVIGDHTVRIPIQLPAGDMREEINLKGHPYLQGKEILVKGCLETYCGSMGVTSPSAYQITYTIPINSYGYATLFLDMPVKVPADCAAYYCTTEGDRVNLFPVGEIIPDRVGVIIKSSPNTACKLYYTTDNNSCEETIRESNQLIGYTEDTTVGGNDNVYYALNAKNDLVGFYIPKTVNDDGSFTAKAGKAYLKVAADNQATMYLFPRDGVGTAVAPITHLSDEVLYDLQGRVVTSPTEGVYIKAGKKVVVK